MSEPKLISPMLDNYIMGDPISNHHGVRCCPAIQKETEEKYIVKIISIPSSQTQLDALLLTGAYPDEASALNYFKELADGIRSETSVLAQLSNLEGFLPYEDLQIVPMEDQTGYQVYLLSPYKRTLSRNFVREPLTHLGAINLGLDLCAALAVCRRSGYLYADLKPNNVFVTGEREYRIGDIGFIKLDSLKYASLPDKYRSAYTAPEISDAFSALNTTLDVYAAGLILYQAYNNGELPFSGDTAPAEVFQPPMYADYEMAEIILKACAPNPEDRWQDPIQMGQALVSYMQRNGANDTPIVPLPVTTEPETEEAAPLEDAPAEAEIPADAEITEAVLEPEDITEPELQCDIVSDEQPSLIPEELEQAESESGDDSFVYTEDSDGNLTFLSSIPDDMAAAEQVAAEVSYNEISNEVSEILSQADDLAAHPVPEPVVAPDPVEITIPEPLPPEEQEATDPVQAAESEDGDSETTAEEELPVDTAEQDAPPTKRKVFRTLIPVCLSVLFLLALLAGGFHYYRNYYLQSVDSIITEGSDDNLTVYISSKISEEKLTVICSDAFGNQFTAPVVDGKAVFTKLVPNTGYSISVQIEGFHKLVGQTSAAYSTPVLTEILQFHAVTGHEDGSVILGFTVDGPDAKEWTVVYSAPGEEERSVTFPSHVVTLTGLTPGKEYTFTLVPDTDLYLAGTSQITFTASKLVYAQDLTVVGCMNNKLSVKWTAPEGSNIDSWTVRCYNKDYDQTIVVTETFAVIDIPDDTSEYNIEVTAEGMSVSERVYLPENSVTVADFHAETKDFQTLTLTWNTSKEIPAEGWYLQYRISGSDAVWTVICKENSAHLSPVLPGTTYYFTLHAGDGVPFLSGSHVYEVPQAPDFKGIFGGMEVNRSDLTFQMCKTPSVRNWTYKDVKASDFTTSFAAKKKASFLVKLNASYASDATEIEILYLVRNADGNPVSSSLQTYKWSQMWNKYYCELDIPNMPTTPGSYTMCIYFNGGLAAEQAFTIQS